MTKRKIYFRADASATIGYGHFVRTLALADMLKDNFDCTFYTTSPSPYQVGEIGKVCDYVVLHEDSKFEVFLDCLSGNEIVVLDNYFFTTEYQERIKATGCKLVCIDDMHNRHYVSDIVINHGLTDYSLFDRESYTELCLGMDYALLRKPFLLNHTIAKEPGSWFVSFGGTDYDNLTLKYVSILEKDPTVRNITVVIGDAYAHGSTLEKVKKARVMRNLSALQMCNEMSRSEYAVLPSSSVCIEALSCKCKIACGYFVDNQYEFYQQLKSSSAIFPIGRLQDYDSSAFVEEMVNFQGSLQHNFATIPHRYIELFNRL